MDTYDESQDAASKRPLHSVMAIRDSLLGYARYCYGSKKHSPIFLGSVMVEGVAG